MAFFWHERNITDVNDCNVIFGLEDISESEQK